MRIDIEVKNKINGFEFSGYQTFNILSCSSPANLWLLRDFGNNTENGVASHGFVYKKLFQ